MKAPAAFPQKERERRFSYAFRLYRQRCGRKCDHIAFSWRQARLFARSPQAPQTAGRLFAFPRSGS